MIVAVVVLAVVVLGLGFLVWQLRESVQQQLTTGLKDNNKWLDIQSGKSLAAIEKITRQLTELERTNKGVSDVASELKTLQAVLQNPKQRGVLGEYYLDTILKNILPPGSFELQHKVAPGMVVDAAIRYDEKWLPIDSKFSLENYTRMIEAEGPAREAYERAFKADIKGRIDETAKYIQPGKDTLDQALMFIPSETIYYDILTERVGLSGRNLLEYAAGKKVTIVGPTTLAAVLQTIVQGLRGQQIHKDTEMIRKNVEALQKHLINHNTYMQKLGTSLGTTVNHFNSTYKELGKIDKDVVKITGVESAIDVSLADKPLLDD